MHRGEYVRGASHAGSWYSGRERELGSQLQDWMSASEPPKTENVKAIIGPHAGYAYCGPTSAAAYRHVDPRSVTRVIIMGPSHHAYLRKCSISGASQLETPVGHIRVDARMRDDLLRTGLYDTMTQQVDEEEHSIEMHLPFLAFVLASNPGATCVPILVGNLSDTSAAKYAETLQPYFEDPGTLFVISSDFCHWGKRFQYTPFDETKFTEIHEYIKWLDMEGMKLIEQHNLRGFREYLDLYSNTICGRNPITVLLTLILSSTLDTTTRFVAYSQSSQAKAMTDSSVSYAAAVVTVAATEKRNK